MFKTMENKLHEVIERIGELEGTLAFVQEFFDEHSIALPNMGNSYSLVMVLRGLKRNAREARGMLEETAEGHTEAVRLLKSTDLGDSPSTASVSSSRLIDMYLNNLDSRPSLDESINTHEEIVALMRENQAARKGRLTSVSESNITRLPEH